MSRAPSPMLSELPTELLRPATPARPSNTAKELAKPDSQAGTTGTMPTCTVIPYYLVRMSAGEP